MVQARYDEIAEFYIEGFDSIDDPASLALLDLLGPVAGLRVLDVACGHGRVTRELARRGASVTGIDVSGALLARALKAEQDERLGIRYLHDDVTRPGALSGFRGSFDVATCNFGLSDIDDLDAAIAAAGDVLKPGGCFVFSIVHPCFAGSADIAGSWPASGSYYDEGHWMAQVTRSELRRRVGANHRTLSTYLAALRRHGLWLDEVAEPLPKPGYDPAHVADRQPVYLAARCVKLPPAVSADPGPAVSA
jgi:2-polyprenyl-3-methyl-5-hydroxy-6-metoxy-1,4-benzoquinol methylase